VGNQRVVVATSASPAAGEELRALGFQWRSSPHGRDEAVPTRTLGEFGRGPAHVPDPLGRAQRAMVDAMVAAAGGKLEPVGWTSSLALVRAVGVGDAAWT